MVMIECTTRMSAMARGERVAAVRHVAPGLRDSRVRVEARAGGPCDGENHQSRSELV